MPEVAFSTVYDDESSVLTVSGEVDELSAGELREAIEKHTDGWSQALAIDLTGVSYLPSAAVGVLATARQRALAADLELGLVAADGSIAQRVLAVCALPYRTA